MAAIIHGNNKPRVFGHLWSFSVKDGSWNYYFQTYIDDFTRLTVTFLMTAKSDTIKTSNGFLMRNKGSNIHTLRTYQGTEYRFNEITEFLMANGITHVPSGIDAHAQRHVAERMNRTLTEMARTMLLDEGLPKC